MPVVRDVCFLPRVGGENAQLLNVEPRVSVAVFTPLNFPTFTYILSTPPISIATNWGNGAHLEEEIRQNVNELSRSRGRYFF